MTTEPQCGWQVYWWDADLDETCKRRPRHAGHHTDGLYWYDDDGHRVPIDPAVDAS
jgi:hypothetical protein